jgi:hypothetical protein
MEPDSGKSNKMIVSPVLGTLILETLVYYIKGSEIHPIPFKTP